MTFNAKALQIQRLILSGEQRAIADAMLLLDELRQEIIAALVRQGEPPLSILRLHALRNEVDRALVYFQNRLTGQMRTDLSNIFRLGNQLIDAPLDVAGFAANFGVHTTLIETASTFSADLITNLTASIRGQVSMIIRRTAVGAVSIQEAIKAVGGSLDSPGVFRSMAARAENIVRTETLRLQAQATQARMEAHDKQLRSSGYQLFKSWLNAGDLRVRATHIVAGIEYAKDNAIAVDEEFTVGGEQCLYPRDESLSAEEACNCRCVAIPQLKKIAVQKAA